MKIDQEYIMPKNCVKIMIITYAIIGLISLALLIKNETSKAKANLLAKRIITVESKSNDPKIADGDNIDQGNDDEDQEILVIEVSAYTSSIFETDSTPYITADGTNLKEVYECVIASNDYDFGTKLAIEGLGVCTVHDRMNKRYDGLNKVDVYMGNDKLRANEFGRKRLSYIVVD